MHITSAYKISCYRKKITNTILANKKIYVFFNKKYLHYNHRQLVACKICGRTFANDRISCHEKVCTKVVNIKRKKFDAMTFRIRGTELEPFVKKGLKKPEVSILSSFIDLSFLASAFFFNYEFY